MVSGWGKWIQGRRRIRLLSFCLSVFLFLTILFVEVQDKLISAVEASTVKSLEIRFGNEANGIPWVLKPENESLRVTPGNVVRGVFKLQSRASRRITVLVRHKFVPPEMIRYLPTLECGLQFTLTMDPGEVQEFESEFFLREGVPEGAGPVRIVFTFELIDEGGGFAEIDRGRSLFNSRCTTCHGSDGKGQTPLGKRFHTPPADLRTSVRRRNDWQLLRFISEGRGMMPAFSPAIDENDLRSVVSFLRSKWGGG